MSKFIDKIVPIQLKGVPYYTIDGNLNIQNSNDLGINDNFLLVDNNDLRLFLVNTTYTPDDGYIFTVDLTLTFLDNSTCQKQYIFNDEIFVDEFAFSEGFSNGFS